MNDNLVTSPPTFYLSSLILLFFIINKPIKWRIPTYTNADICPNSYHAILMILYMIALQYCKNRFPPIGLSGVMAIAFIEPSLFFTCRSHRTSLIMKCSLKWLGCVKIARKSCPTIISKSICLQCGKNTSSLYKQLPGKKKRRNCKCFGIKSVGLTM